MNLLSKHPHLFANGKFRVKIHGTSKGEYGKAKFGIDKNGKLKLERWFKGHENNCTLIARPIESLTDEEVQWFIDNDGLIYDVDDFEGVRDYLSGAWHTTTLNADEMVHLLEIGVYPFDQSHFGDTVIDSTTL